VHTHSFSSRHIPIKGIILGKRDAHWLGSAVPDSFSCELADFIHDRSEKIDSKPIIANHCHYNQCGLIPAKLLKPINRGLINIIEYGVFIGSGQALNPRPARDSKVKSIYTIGGDLFDEHHKTARKFQAEFSSQLLEKEERKQGSYIDHYKINHKNRIPLYVTHLMDLAPVYDQEEDGVRLLHFHKQQIPSANNMQKKTNAKNIYFVAFNPFRDHWEKGNGQPGDSLEIVKDAILNHGAYGVKVYPPSGYRPTDNVSIDRKKDKILRRPVNPLAGSAKRQWDARYKNVSGAEIDRRLDRLYAWCQKYDIPIFTHCGLGEFEARKHYGKALASPEHWEKVLKKYKNLRICFGHSGGEDYWFGMGDSSDYDYWGQTVARLCREYKNVYCEFGAHADITIPRRRELFIERLSKNIGERGKYKFKNKILFGTDFFMPSSLQDKFLEDYLLAFRDIRLKDYQRGFFYSNAIRFLNVNKRMYDKKIPTEVRKRLQALPK